MCEVCIYRQSNSRFSGPVFIILKVKEKMDWGVLPMKSKCLIKIEQVLEMTGKTQMSSKLTNSAQITVTAGYHLASQLPSASPQFFCKVSLQMVSTMCSRMSLCKGFHSGPLVKPQPQLSYEDAAPLSVLSPAVCSVTWSLNQLSQWLGLPKLCRKTAFFCDY